jgi:chromosomal replication initiation ATPase DnaA
MKVKRKINYPKMELLPKYKERRKQHRVFLEDIDINYLKTMGVIFFKRSISEIDGIKGGWELTDIRHLLIYISYYNSKVTLKDIGLYFGNKHYSSVIHARDSTQDRLDTLWKFKKKYLEFIEFINLEKIKQEEAA